MAQITARNGRKHVKNGDKEKNRPLNFKVSFILVVMLFMNRIVHFVTCVNM